MSGSPQYGIPSPESSLPFSRPFDPNREACETLEFITNQAQWLIVQVPASVEKNYRETTKPAATPEGRKIIPAADCDRNSTTLSIRKRVRPSRSERRLRGSAIQSRP